MIKELLRAFFFIFAAEMGDKTQILAMTFATQFTVGKVLLGVFIGSALNHGIAIALGSYISKLIPINTVQMIAGLLFIGFGLWALKDDEDEEEEQSKTKLGPVLTVAMAFFIGELGDKTQLTAMTLSTDANYPLFILFGTVLGMIVTSSFGIYIGSKIGKKIPEIAIKLGSAAVFIFFGTLKLFQTVPEKYITTINVILYFSVIFIIIFILLKPLIKRKGQRKSTALREAAVGLYNQTHKVKEAVDEICLGEEHCGKCKNERCTVGQLKKLLDNNDKINNINFYNLDDLSRDKFDKDKVIEALSITLSNYIEDKPEENSIIDNVRKSLETLLFGESIPYEGDLNKYFQILKGKDTTTAEKIIRRVDELDNISKI